MRRKAFWGICAALAAAIVVNASASATPVAPINDGGVSKQVLDVTFMYKIKVDGTTCDTGPILWRGQRVYVQVRGFASCLGADVMWIPGGSIRPRPDSDGPGVAGVTFSYAGKVATVDLEPTIENQTTRVEEMPNDFTYYNLGSMAPFIKDGRTYLPFRAMTDAADFKLEFIPGVPNVINVIRGEHAIPQDGYLINSAHVIVDRDADEPFRLASTPSGGWPFSPATKRTLEATFLQTNWAITKIRRDPEAKSEMNFDSSKVRIDVRAYDTVNPVHVTYYGTHMIRWFDDYNAALSYQTDLALSNLTQGFLTSAGAGVGSGGVAFLLGAAATPWVVAGGSVTMAYWVYANRYDDRVLSGCMDRSKLDEVKDKHKPGEPVFGILYGIQGTVCVPYYTDSAIDANGLAQ